MPDETVGDKPADDEVADENSDAEASNEEQSAETPEEGDSQSATAEKSESGSLEQSGGASAAEAASKSPSEKPADDKAETRSHVRRLRRSVGMAMPNNRYRVFLGRGAIPPVSEKKHFVARLKKLDRLQVVILEGDENDASNNEYVGEVGLGNLKLRQDGRAEIEIEYSLSDKGILSVALYDKIGRIDSIAKFVLPQFAAGLPRTESLAELPVNELSMKIDVLEQQMQLLKGELAVRREKD